MIIPQNTFARGLLSKEKELKRSVIAVINQDSRYLLVKRSDFDESAPSYWCPVSGTIQEGEHPVDTLHREIKEEIGVDCIPCYCFHQNLTSCKSYRMEWWKVDILGNPVISSDEISEIVWLTIDEMSNLCNIFPEDISVLRFFQQNCNI